MNNKVDEIVVYLTCGISATSQFLIMNIEMMTYKVDSLLILLDMKHFTTFLMILA